jgi:hypothetical protein
VFDHQCRKGQVGSVLRLKYDQLVKIYRLWGPLPPPLQRPADGPWA